MEHNWKGAFHGHATVGYPALGAAARTGTGPRPRPAARRARALRGAVEDRRWGISPCSGARRLVEAARSRYRLRLAGPLSDPRPGRAERPPARRITPDPASTSRRGPSASQPWGGGGTSRRGGERSRNRNWP